MIAAAAALTLFLPALPAAAIAPMADPALLPATEPMTPQRIEAANDAYNDAEATLEFITMSDTELGGSATADKTSEQVAYEGAKPHFQALRSWAEAKGFEPRVVVDNATPSARTIPSTPLTSPATARRSPAGTARSNASCARRSRSRRCF